MAANATPIWIRKGNIGFNKLVTANTTRDLTSGTTYLICTADAVEGSRVQSITLQPLGTNVATVVRIWLNNGGSPGTATNNTLLDEMTMPATTASEVAELAKTDVPLDLVLPLGWRIYCTIGTGIAAGIHATAVGGDY